MPTTKQFSTSKWLPTVLRFYYDHRDLTTMQPHCSYDKGVLTMTYHYRFLLATTRLRLFEHVQNNRGGACNFPTRRRSHPDQTTLMENLPRLARDWPRCRPFLHRSRSGVYMCERGIRMISLTILIIITPTDAPIRCHL